MTAPAQHPPWCDRPERESADEAHSSRPIPLNPGGDEQLLVSVRLLRSWPPFNTWWISLAVTEDGDTSEHLFTLGQGTALTRALPLLLRLARTHGHTV